jgi:hypothetical protein
MSTASSATTATAPRATAPVLSDAGEREEHVARPHAPRIDGDALHLDVAEAAGGRGDGEQIA